MSYFKEMVEKNRVNTAFNNWRGLCADASSEVDRLRARNQTLVAALKRALTAINAGFGKAQRDHIIAKGREALSPSGRNQPLKAP